MRRRWLRRRRRRRSLGARRACSLLLCVSIVHILLVFASFECFIAHRIRLAELKKIADFSGEQTVTAEAFSPPPELPPAAATAGAAGDAARAAIRARLVASVRDQIGPVAAFRHVAFVRRLPKTRSGKILRRTMRLQADGHDWTLPATVDDATVFEEIEAALRSCGIERVGQQALPSS